MNGSVGKDIYPLNIIPQKYMHFYFLNPMVGIIDSYRRILVHKMLPNFEGLIIGWLFSLIIFIIAYYIFKRAEKIFADVL